jgi:hypothetical protein
VRNERQLQFEGVLAAMCVGALDDDRGSSRSDRCRQRFVDRDVAERRLPGPARPIDTR